MSTKPERRHVVEIKVGGDTEQDLLTALRQMHYAVQAGEHYADTGTPTTTAHMRRRHHPEMTHDKYVDALIAHVVEDRGNG
jgi:hypothetical protein